LIPRECKRLGEVDFPIAVVSKHAAREKSIRHGHPSTLHLWWARRPLASCRAMLLALLLPDPCDPHCPEDFKAKAREFLRPMPGRLGNSDEDLREALLRFIGDFANWDNAASAAFLEAGRGLVKAAHPEETPLVVDPFAGGGSIPLEALRLGCDAFASDLNPVACLILKTVLEDIPRFGPGLADELRRSGSEIKALAEKELAAFYPPDPDGSRPIAYLWARTVHCEAPNCGAEIPLMRSFWLSNKKSRRRALQHRVIRSASEIPRIEFEVFEPKGEQEVPVGTVTRAKAKCIACAAVMTPERVRAQLGAQRGGAEVVFDAAGRRTGGARMLAVVTLQRNEAGRHYRLPREPDYETVCRAGLRVHNGGNPTASNGLSAFPDEVIPRTELRRISLPLYGIDRFRDMFTARQLISLSEIAKSISDTGYSTEISRLLTLCLGKIADLNNANTRWKPDAECPVNTLARHDIPAAWDFTEATPFGEASGSFHSAYERTASSISPSICRCAEPRDSGAFRRLLSSAAG
jgi:putative DNA methylase